MIKENAAEKAKEKLDGKSNEKTLTSKNKKCMNDYEKKTQTVQGTPKKKKKTMENSERKC